MKTYTTSYGRDDKDNVFDLIDNAQVGDTIISQGYDRADTKYKVVDVQRDYDYFAGKNGLDHLAGLYDELTVYAVAILKNGKQGLKVMKIDTKFIHRNYGTSINITYFTKGWLVKKFAKLNPDHVCSRKVGWGLNSSDYCRHCFKDLDKASN